MACVSGCTEIGDMVRRIARQLNDFEVGEGVDFRHVRWHPETLVGFINEALCEISQHRPDAFVETVTLTLSPGSTQRLPKEYSQLLNIEANTSISPDGAVTTTAPVRKDATTTWRDIYAVVSAKGVVGCNEEGWCVTPDGSAQFEIKSYTPNVADDSVFSVYPPVPVGSSASVLATVVAKPTKHCAANPSACLGIACKYEAQVLDWAMHRAYGQDFESNFNANASARHLKAFYDALGVKRLAESLFNQEITEGEPVPASHQNRRLATTNR